MTFERRIRFEKGYNYSHETGPRSRGIHGMGIRFVLIGPDGAAQFLMNTGWVPVVDKPEYGYGETHHKTPSLADYYPSGSDLGYHWATPQYEGQGSPQRCDLLPGGECYFDGSGLMADEVLRDFIREGERAVWRWLVKRYRWCIEQDAEYRATLRERVAQL